MSCFKSDAHLDINNCLPYIYLLNTHDYMKPINQSINLIGVCLDNAIFFKLILLLHEYKYYIFIIIAMQNTTKTLVLLVPSSLKSTFLASSQLSTSIH